MQEETGAPAQKPEEANLDWKPTAHTAPGPGIEPGMHWCKAREVTLHYLLPPSLYVEPKKSLLWNTSISVHVQIPTLAHSQSVTNIITIGSCPVDLVVFRHTNAL